MANNYSGICPASVEAALKTLRQGDNVTVIWCDASESANVPMRKAIHNHSVESVCTAVGIYYGVKKGTTYADLHLLIVKDYLDSEKMRVQSIPLALVKSIQVFRGSKQTKKLLMTIHKRKLVLHFQDGSVKYIGGL
jgi:hypothetical protein